MSTEIIFGFELALPPDIYHEWNEYVPFVPNDSEEVMQLSDNENLNVKG